MTEDYFDRLDVALAERVRDGAHLCGSSRPLRQHLHLLRRAAGATALAITLAFCLVAEFPAAAHSTMQSPPAPRAHILRVP